MRTPFFLLLLGCLLFAFGCETPEDDDAADDDAADDDAVDDDAADDDAADDDDTMAGNCEYEGSWNLVTFLCGEYDITGDWFDIMDSTVMVFSSTVDGCNMVMTNSSASCVETEEFEFDSNTGDGDSLGVTSCDPSKCTFNGQDAPCIVGDRAGPVTMGTLEMVGDTLHVTSMDLDGLCGKLETIQTWERM
jgi:hypothetical protein